MPPIKGLLTADSRAELGTVELSAAGRQLVDTALAAIDALTAQITPLRAQLQAVGSRGRGRCRRTMGSGRCARRSSGPSWVTAGGLATPTRRCASPDWMSPCTHRTADVPRAGWPAKGSPELGWALFEAAKVNARQGSPEHDYYTAMQQRLGGKRPALSVARKLTRRCHHTLRDLGDQAWAPLGAAAESKAA